MGEWLPRVAEGCLVVEDDGLADGLDDRGPVDEGRTDDVFGCRDGRRRGHERPDVSAGRRVEGRGEFCEGLVAVRAERGGVLDLLEPDDIRVQRVDRRDDLRLLALEVFLLRCSSSVASAVHRDRVADPVGVIGAAGEFVTGGREVVEHVEGREGDSAPDVLRARRARVLEGRGLHGRRVLRGEVLHRLEAPGPEPVVEHDGSRERDGRADPHRVLGRQVRQRNRLVGGRVEVRGRSVVESHDRGLVRREHREVLGASRLDDRGGLHERGVARRQNDGTVVVRVVVVGDGVVPGRREQHSLERFTLGDIGRERDRCGHRSGHDLVDDRHSAADDGELRHPEVFAHFAGDLDVAADRGPGHRLGRVDEDALG